jgi:GNAT superfamily N-acetyltransferase
MPSATEFELRLASPQDTPAIANVLHESFAQFEPLYTPGGFAATALDEAQILARMNEGPVWILLRDRMGVGTVAAVIRDGSVYVRGMAVVPSARGLGAGARLLREVENWAAAQGHARLFLSTTPFLDSAIRLYERFGFRRTNDRPHDLAGTPLFTMQKIVST